MSINIAEYDFKGPYSDPGFVSDESGVYVILNAAHQVIDVGESQNLRTRLLNHNRENCWNRHKWNCIAILYANEQGRMQIEQHIRDKCNPPCGER